jgi:hypothetical protein
MTPTLRSLGIAGLVILSVTACAQQPPPAAARPGPGPAAMMPPPPPLAPPPPIADAGVSTTAITGRIQRWLLNPNGDVDGLLLADGTQVAFPPHLSTAVLQIAKPGDSVKVSGWRASGAPVMRASSLTATAGGRSVVDQPPAPGMAPPPPRDPSSLASMTASGKVSRVLYTDRGDANGVLLDSGDIVRFPPQAASGVTPPVQVGSTLSARGWGTRNALGSAFEATAMGSSPDSLRDLFAGPGRVPGGPAPMPMGAMPPSPGQTPPPTGATPPAPPASS